MQPATSNVLVLWPSPFCSPIEHTHTACIYFDDPMSNHCCIYLANILSQRNNSMISCTARTDGRWPAQQAAHNIVFRRTAANVAHSPCPATIGLSTYVLNNAARRLLRSTCARAFAQTQTCGPRWRSLRVSFFSGWLQIKRIKLYLLCSNAV